MLQMSERVLLTLQLSALYHIVEAWQNHPNSSWQDHHADCALVDTDT